MCGYNLVHHVTLAYLQPTGFNIMILQADSLYIKRSGKTVLNGISFGVNEGEVYALLGGNGAGKSTTLLSFLGFLSPAQGHVRVNGTDVSDDLTAARHVMAYLPESASLYEHLNAYENLQYFLRLAGANVQLTAIETTLDQVALASHARSRKLREYSKGMRQKVAIALSILRNTDILLLDEPTSGLDPGAIDDFHRIVRDFADKGKAVLMVTHDVYGACQIADRVGLLRDGKLVDEFTAEDGARIDTKIVHNAFSKTAGASLAPKL